MRIVTPGRMTPFAMVAFLTYVPLLMAADAKDAETLYKSAIAAQTGKGAKLDLAQGKALLLQAAEAGSAKAMDRLGDMYGKPDGGVALDLKQARQWYDKAAALNDPYGLLWSANLPDHTLAPEVEKERFAKAFEVAKAASLKDPSAVFVVSVFYATGNGVPADPSIAFDALQQAAGDGDLNAMRELASSYAHGNGTAVDLAKAFQWYSKAAESGFSVHLMDLGIWYDSERYGAHDNARALDYYLQAADRGSARCMTNAGQMISAGQGAAVDLPRAAALYQKAADLGWPPAMYYLGMCYDTGKGVAQNHETAVAWIRKSAAWSNPKAKQYLKDHDLPAAVPQP